MATLLFIIFRLVGLIDLPYPESDFYAAIRLLALDTISVMILLLVLTVRRLKTR